eukprot:Colp12_sorted_trinity150504_noHs@24462
MGFPADSMEGVYRNNIEDVVRFFDKRHPDHYKIYNLCSERGYSPAKFHNRVATYAFDDHNAPPFELIKPFCEDVHEWLNESELNVAVIHCKAGKGRTGVMISAYLLHAGSYLETAEALRFYGEARTKNSKGVTIPSQRRYVDYYNQTLRNKLEYSRTTIFLKGIRINTIPMFTNNSCVPFFTVKLYQTKIYQSKPLENVDKKSDKIEIKVEPDIPLCGDVKIEFFHKDKFKKEKMFHFWFNTFFIQDNVLTIPKSEIDKANKDRKHKNFKANMTVDVLFTGERYQQNDTHGKPEEIAAKMAAPLAAMNLSQSADELNGEDEDLSSEEEDDEWKQ